MNQLNMSQIVSPVEFVDTIIEHAVSEGASDIHLESTENGLRVRFRIDGVLFDRAVIDKEVMPQIISRVKVLAHINLAQKRIPQDGKFRMSFDKLPAVAKGYGGHSRMSGVKDKPIDMRVSTFPSVYGEKVVIRILDRSQTMIDLDQLGFDPITLARFRQLINKPQGFLVVTGPTGSGKTTTLYGALAELNQPEKHIVTLEDPVEYHLDGIVQGNIHPEAGFTFAKGIRSILRQDPDIAFIGEVRDTESAKIAIEAALTGHLVFSTLHTNDAPGAIMRLMDMGIEPFLINAAVTGVLAQRLVRTNCKSCTTSTAPSDEEKVLMEQFEMDVPLLFKGNGCEQCNDRGYKGRAGIFELLTMTSSMRSLIVQHPDFDAIQIQARKDGMKTLLQDALQKVHDGLITLDELVRVVA